MMRLWLGSGLFALCAAAFALFLHYRHGGAVQPEPPRPPLTGIRQSHIEGNVPAAEDFRAFLTRDLEAYFEDAGARPIRAKFQLLRDAPTQSGVALPKFYAWVRITCAGEICREGAARIAAAEKIRFDILTFVSKTDIIGDPGRLAAHFPAALIPLIMARAGVKP